MSALAATAGQFFQWWLDELRGMVPRRLKALVDARKERLVIRLDGDDVIVGSQRNGTFREVARMTASEAEGGALAGVIAPGTGAHRETVLRLPAACTLRKRLSLPLAARGSVREALALDMDRQTPFEADQVYFDTAIARIDRANGRLDVDLVLAPATVVEDALARLAGFGVTADKVDVDWETAHGPAVNLLAGHARPAAATRARRVTQILAVIVLILGVAWLGTAWVELLQAEESVAAAATAARTEAEGARRIQEKIDALERQHQFLARERSDHAIAIAVLDELTRVLPDDTYLTRFTLTGDQIQAVGYSTNASTLIELIEGSPQFENTQFLAALVREPRRSEERFHIGFKALAEHAP